MEILKQLLARLHPVLVHLPIGFIILGLILHVFDRKKKEYTNLIGLIFFWGGITALLTSITGYLQYLSDGYSYDTVKMHLWLGVVTTVICFVIYVRLNKDEKFTLFNRIPIKLMLILLFIGISYTGHLGGSITHGENYLVEPLPNAVKSFLGFETFEEKQIELDEKTYENAALYTSLIDPILNNKCVSCHNTNKHKGGLKLNSPEAILLGGENGSIIFEGNAEKSELYTRLVLPEEDDNHMPPNGKTQLTKEEIKLIFTWISKGNSFDKSIGELGVEKRLLETFFPKKKNDDFPDIEIAKARLEEIENIEKLGIHVQNITKHANFLKVSCINQPNFTDADFEKLMPIADQIAVLDLGNTQITDDGINKLMAFKHLTVLSLDHTVVSGKNIEALAELAHLKKINLTGSKFQIADLTNFSSFPSLKAIYLYNTALSEQGLTLLKEGKIKVEYGNYSLPSIASDTIVY